MRVLIELQSADPLRWFRSRGSLSRCQKKKKNELFLLEGFVTQRRMVLRARVTGIWFLSKIEKARYYADAIFMEMKTTNRTTHNDKQKSDFVCVARPSNAFQIVAPHVIHILTYTARARKLSPFYFCSRLLLYGNLFTLLNFNFLFVVAFVVYLHYLFIAIDRQN